jgi:undecaprenyl-diphosphatase
MTSPQPPSFDRLNAREIVLIRRVAHGCRRPAVRWLAMAVNRLGDGGIYLVIALGLPLFEGRGSLKPLLASLLSAGLAFCAYLPMKRFLGRARPCDFDPTIASQALALDRYSCPSGHLMTVVAAGLPLGQSYPALMPLLLLAAALIAWARLALAHHYTTDLVAGALLGLAAAGTVAALT